MPALLVEDIPDSAVLARRLEFRRTFSDVREVIWTEALQFSGGKPESFDWNKYALFPDGVHMLGCVWEADKRLRRPEMRYVGYASVDASAIRSVRSKNLFGFAVQHAPDGVGPHHVHVSIKPFGSVLSLSKPEKNDLRVLISKAFGAVVEHTCAQ